MHDKNCNDKTKERNDDQRILMLLEKQQEILNKVWDTPEIKVIQ